MKNILFVTVILFSSVSFSLPTESDLYFSTYIKLFEENSRYAMDQIPPKFNRSGRMAVSLKKAASYQERIQSREFIKGGHYQPFSEAINKSRIENFFPHNASIVRKLEEFGENLKVSLPSNPWSGDYWPTYKGGIGVRYADSGTPVSEDFQDYYKAYQNYWPLDYRNEELIDHLSPSEKYDILVGDESFTMTRWTFEDANDVYKANGNKIDRWFGICHGWAPASFMMERPENVVEYQIQNFQGQDFTLKFYPDDVKALSSLLWANTTLETYFMGGRCNTKNPPKDPKGRILDEDCFDLNPGSWHVAVVNQVGINQSSLVMDASYDYEVWNQPLLSYEVQYFHPVTKTVTGNLSAALIPVEEFSNDKFQSYRSPKTKFVVGVHMVVTYMMEGGATHEDINTDLDDHVRMVHYIYDLELNENGEIIGGEWYQNVHPDFVWTPDKKARAVSVMDRELRGHWSGNQKVPQQWSQKAAFAATYGQPLAAVVEGLIKRARQD